MKINYRRLWQYTFSVAVLMLVIGTAITPSDVHRYAGRMEQLMAEGDYQAALEVGSRSDKTDRRLLMLRMEALDHEHQMGDRLFSYPVTGKSGQLGAKGGDYAICACLIDKQLDRFVELLPKYYKIDDKLPRFYREALILYNHLRTNPRILYHDNVLDTDYRDMQELEAKYPDRKARQMAVFRHYENTYWYYYEYLN